MNKSTPIIVVDISSDYFDTYARLNGHCQYANNKEGFQKLLKILPEDAWVVMEATGSYHHQLALYLFDKGVRLSVVNPLVIKRYIQMKLTKLKTDKSDAKLISHYGEDQPLELWNPPQAYVEECRQIQTVLQLYFKQSTALKNKLHNLDKRGTASKWLQRSIKRSLKSIQKEIMQLEAKLEELIKTHEQDLYSRLKSIPGIGKKTAIMLIVCSDGFKKFEHAKQMISFLGLAPFERSSGSSVRGKSRISKAGDPLIRNHLFMCSFTACNCNPACKALFERIVNKGKSKKLALIAVSSKLVKQAFGVAKNQIPFDPAYQSKLA